MAMKHQYDDDQKDDLIINVFPELRRRITIAAAQSNLSVQEYVEGILEQVVPSEALSTYESDGRLDRVALDDLLRYREEIRRAYPGQVFEDSAELLHQAREERTKELEQR